MSSIGKSGARSSGPTGCPVPGCSTGCGAVGMSERMLYQRRGSCDSSSRNFEESQLPRSEEHTSELQSQSNLVCRLLLEKKKKKKRDMHNTRRNQRTANRS